MRKSNKERLFELASKLDPTILEGYENRILKESNTRFNEDNSFDNDKDEEDKPSQKDIEKVNTIDREADNTQVSDNETEKPVVDQNNRTVKFKVAVPVYMKNLADRSIESLKKFAKKMGAPEPIIETGQPYKAQKTVVYASEDGDERHYTIVQEVYDLIIDTSPVFKMSGNYKLVAIVDNVTGGSIETDENENVPTEMLQTNGQCDLCNQERYRGKNFIVKDLNKNEYLCVGSSCVKKYIGVDPNKFIRALDFFRSFRDTLVSFTEDDGFTSYRGGGNRFKLGNVVVPPNKLITLVKNLIDEHGYEKKEYSEYRPYDRTNLGNATSEKALDYIFDNEYDKFINEYPVDDEYVNNIKNFFTNFQFSDNMSEGFKEYIENVQKLFADDKNIRIKDAGMFGSAINFYNNNLKREKENEKVKDSEWIGEVGTKHPFPHLTLVDAKSGEGNYGTWYLWSFIDQEGNSFKKFGNLNDKFIIEKAPDSAEDLFGYNKGDVFAFTAEIKKHDEYRGIKNTVLGRISKL